MRRFLTVLTVLVLAFGVICMPASAESAATSVDLYCTVSDSGDCYVTMNVQLQLDTATTGLTFPLPVNATDITMGGSNVSTKKTTTATQVDIGKVTNGYVGSASLTFSYTIPEAVKVNPERKLMKDKLQLDIPLLCGFEYPVQSLSFVVTMPSSDLTNPPTLTSTYQQQGVESNLRYTISGSQIIGSNNTVLNDHDSVHLSMIVPDDMFPTVSTYIRDGNPEIVYMVAFGVVALLYWLLFLRGLPLIRSRTSTPPEGVTAGEMGCRLTLVGGDLTMMVFTWAQLGYILIHLDGNGRVLLHKRMDMGNERGPYENKVFRELFGNRRVVDGTGVQYARLCRKVAGTMPNERNLYKGNSGNVKLFRGIACGSMVFCGICVAMNLSSIPVLYVLMSIILGVFGAVSAWLIQDVAYRNHLRGKIPVYIGFVCILIWVLLGVLCEQVWIPVCCCLGEFVVGYFAAYGGRRSELGRLQAGQVLGLRSYLKRVPRDEIGRLLKNDPDYYFNLAPYALALGVINPYSRAFGRRKLDQCPYLMTRVHGKRTAEEWGQLMADVADMMDAKARRMQIERFMAVQIQVSKK